MSVIRASDSPRPQATAAKVSGMLSDGKWHRVTASVYGRADSGGNPACGGSLSGPTWFAELGNGAALGGLPCGTKIDIKGPSGEVMTMAKRDRNSTARDALPGLEGTPRCVDVWKENGAPERLGIGGLAVVEVRLSQGGDAGSFGSDARTDAASKRYEFTRGEKGGKRENSWDASGRLAEEVAFSRWAAGNVLGYASQDELIAAVPAVELAGDEPFLLDQPQWSWSPHRPIEELTIHVSAERWGVMPGGVVLWDAGRPFDGRWLVSKASGESLTSPVVEVVMKRPTHKKAEPAAESAGAAGGSDSGSASGDVVLEGTPKEIIDRYVLPIGRKHGLHAANGGALTPANVSAANGAHSTLTTSGNVSDHKGPPDHAWAADMLTGSHRPDEAKDATAKELMQMFGLPGWKGDGQGAGMVKTTKGYRIQMLYQTSIGGNHFNHVHFGLHRV